MTYATFDAAINALNAIPTTQEGIMNFVRQLSVQADGAVTYSKPKGSASIDFLTS